MKAYTLDYISGNNIGLRPIIMEDTPLIVKWRNNPNVMKNFIYQGVLTEDIHNHWMKTRVETGEVIQYIIEEMKTGKPIGSIYLRDIQQEYRSAEFGIFIGEDDARGYGYGAEATKLFVQKMFKCLNLHRIFLRVLEGNEAALKSYQKVGFVQEGRFRDMVKIDGTYRDVIFMSIIEKEV